MAYPDGTVCGDVFLENLSVVDAAGYRQPMFGPSLCRCSIRAALWLRGISGTAWDIPPPRRKLINANRAGSAGGKGCGMRGWRTEWSVMAPRAAHGRKGSISIQSPARWRFAAQSWLGSNQVRPTLAMWKAQAT